MMSLFSAATPSVFFRNSKAFGDGSQDGSIVSKFGKLTDFLNWLVPISMTHHRALDWHEAGPGGTPNKLLISTGGMGVFINYQTKPC